MEQFVILKEFLQRHEAETAQGLLEENGIKSILLADDCGGLRAGMTFGCAIKLKVGINDLEKATETIKVLDD
ncbi:MAG: hypothetical protein KAS66_10355 [Candidatus Omnitrophica bacterium]|nr:hypothetical protein [Candidatus Omnitrophota bacterium]